MAKYVTVKRVPLCKVGTWGASTGPTVVTPEVMQAMIDAEKEIGRGVVKIGHRDPRFSNPTFDGDPVYGQVANLSTEGDVLYGDLVNVPEELAESMKSAYPNRSVEIAWGVKLRDAAGNVRKTLKAALIGLALLGATPPAVKGMAALSALSAGQADSVSMLSSMVMTADAEAAQEALRDAAVGLYAEKRGDLTLVELTESTITFSAPGQTYRATYTIEDGIYVFSDTESISGDFPQQQLPIADADLVSNDGGTAGKPTSERSEATMDFLTKLREKLGLPEGATEDEIFAAANAAPAAPAAPLVTAASGAPETVAVSKAVFDALQTDFSETKNELAAMKAQAAAKERDAFIMSCLSEGRIHVSEKDYWRKALDQDEEGTSAFLSARTPVVPVREAGSDAAPDLDPNNLSEDQFKAAASQFGVPL